MSRVIRYLDYVIYWAIVGIPFSISIAPGMTFTFMGLLGFSFLLKKIIKRERFFISTSINLQLLLFIVVSVISIKNSIDYGSSFRGITRLFQDFFLLLICAEEIKDKKHVLHIVAAAVLGTCLSSIDGLWQVVFGKDFIRGHEPILNIGIKRATAAFPNSNVLGIYLSALAPLIIGLALFYYKGRRKIFMLLASSVVILGIALTLSRGTALALYLSVLFLSIMRKNKIISGALIILLVVFPFIMPKNIKDWAAQVNYNPIRFMLNDDRIVVYKHASNMIAHHPIIGVGVNTFSKNYLKYKVPESDNARTGDTMYAHNHFMQMAGEIGLLGLAMFLWLLWRLFKENFRIYRNLKDDYLKIVSLSLAACLIAFLFNGLTETSLYYSRVSMIFWYLIGFSLALKKFTASQQT